MSEHIYKAEVFVITETDNYELVTIYVAADSFADAERVIYKLVDYHGQLIFAIHSIVMEG